MSCSCRSRFSSSLPLVRGVGYLGVEIMFAESVIAISCLTLGGGLLLLEVQRYRVASFVAVAAFATVHGYSHLIGLPAGFSPGWFTLGVLSASAIMHVTGIFIGEAFGKSEEHSWLIRVFGLAMIVFGALFLIRSLKSEPREGERLSCEASQGR